MLTEKFGRWLATAAAILVVTIAAADEAGVKVGELSALDRQFMAQQRATLQDLAGLELGRRFNSQQQNDIEILQLLLDRRVIKSSDTRELQAMGVIMGDLLAADLDMHWVIYEDSYGRSRALRYKESNEYLFPITMISRRREADNHTPVADIYQRAYDIIAPLRPPQPFQ